jgi:hypothetical protein
MAKAKKKAVEPLIKKTPWSESESELYRPDPKKCWKDNIKIYIKEVL